MRSTSGRLRAVALATTLVLAGASIAATTTQIAGQPEPGNRSQVTSPYWNGADRAASASGLVGSTLSVIPGANAAAVEARWQHIQARNELWHRTDDFVRNFETSKPFLAAKAEYDDAWSAYRDARDARLSR
ncbi:MAG: hypothetical protein QM770_12500 [Tepidisphaeraceae bacterium]